MPSRHRECWAGTEQAPGAVTSSGGMELYKLGGQAWGGWSCHKLGGMELSQARGGGAVTSSAGYAGPSCLAGRLADVERMCSFFLAGMCIELDGRRFFLGM